MWTIIGACLEVILGGVIAWSLWTLHKSVHSRLADVAAALRTESEHYAQKMDIYLINNRIDSVEARIDDMVKASCPKCCDDDKK